jgi:adenylate kinase
MRELLLVCACYMKDATVILFMGRPGSGKGTQAKLLADKLGSPIFSTGTIFKQLRDGADALSERIRGTYDAGKLMPDWFASYLFEDFFLKLDPASGAICEGFPRSLRQAELYEDVLTWLAREHVVINLDVPEEETLRRQIERAKTEHRPDSDEATIRTRFAEYEKNTAPVLEFFKEKGVLVNLDGTPTVAAIHQNVCEALNIS